MPVAASVLASRPPRPADLLGLFCGLAPAQQHGVARLPDAAAGLDVGIQHLQQHLTRLRRGSGWGKAVWREGQQGIGCKLARRHAGEHESRGGISSLVCLGRRGCHQPLLGSPAPPAPGPAQSWPGPPPRWRRQRPGEGQAGGGGVGGRLQRLMLVADRHTGVQPEYSQSNAAALAWVGKAESSSGMSCPNTVLKTAYRSSHQAGCVSSRPGGKPGAALRKRAPWMLAPRQKSAALKPRNSCRSEKVSFRQL